MRVQSSAQIRNDSLAKKHNPDKATLLSALLPGAGQVYNRKYWKLPILYAALATDIYFISYNGKKYEQWKTAYQNKVDGDASTIDNYPNIPGDQLLGARDYYRRYHDLDYIILGGIYVLNIIDAYVDAQMFDYNVSDDLSLHISPCINLSRAENKFNYVGISVSLIHF